MINSSEFRVITKELTALPSDVPVNPGMIGEEECKYLYMLTSSRFAGCGDVVEIGSWLGKSANYLAAGISRSGFDRKLHCYDNFKWTTGHAIKANKKGYWDDHDYIKPGGNFLSHFEANTSKYGGCILPHKTDIKDIAWTGGPIEILFLDAPKQFETLLKTFNVFGSSLIADSGLLVIQDYLYFPAYPIALFCHGLKEYFKPLHCLTEGSTVSFSVEKKIEDLGTLRALYDYRQWTDTQHDRAWDEILDQLPPNSRNKLSLGRVLSLYDRNRKDEAISVLNNMDISDKQFEKAKSVINTLGSRYPELARILIPDIKIRDILKWNIKNLIKKIIRPNSNTL